MNEQEQVPMKSGTVAVDGGRLFYREAGAGRPVVLIHGFGLDQRMWTAQFAALAPHRRVIGYDLRGFGRSSSPAGDPYTHTADLNALLDQLQIDQAALVGMSLGGGVALDFTLTSPARVERLVLVDAVLGGYRFSPDWTDPMKQIWKTGRSGDVAAARSLWESHPIFAPSLANPFCQDLVRAMIAAYPGWHWTNRDPLQELNPPAAERLAEIKTPTLIAIGERDVADFQHIATLLDEKIPHSQKITLPDAGHMSNLEAPMAFNQVLLEFLGISTE